MLAAAKWDRRVQWNDSNVASWTSLVAGQARHWNKKEARGLSGENVSEHVAHDSSCGEVIACLKSRDSARMLSAALQLEPGVGLCE